MDRAKALFFDAPGTVSLREVDLPTEAAPGEVEVTSALIGISQGTEMRVFRGELPQAGEADAWLSALSCPMRYPLRYGYINVGATAAGQRVFAFYPHQTRFRVPEAETVALPPDIGDDDAVFLASMETAVAICQDAAPVLGDQVLVVGQGVIGLLVAELLSRCAPVRIVTLEPQPARRRTSAALGCLALDPKDPSIAALLAEATSGRGFDVAVNVSATDAGLQAAIDSLAFGATVIEASFYGDRAVSLRLGEAFHRKRLLVRSSQVSTIAPQLAGRWDKRRRLALALQMLRLVRPSRHITHRFPLERAQQAYDLIDRSPGEVLQVVLEP